MRQWKPAPGSPTERRQVLAHSSCVEATAALGALVSPSVLGGEKPLRDAKSRAVLPNEFDVGRGLEAAFDFAGFDGGF